MNSDKDPGYAVLALFALLGSAVCFGLCIFLPVTVETRVSDNLGALSGYPSYNMEEVVNLSLLQRQTFLFIGGAALAVVAMVFFVASSIIVRLDIPPPDVARKSEQ